MITYVQRKATVKEVLPIYEAVGWTSYTTKIEMLKKALENTIFTLLAIQDERVVGLLRAVGDGSSIVFIQDILVLPEFQRKGIGRNLLTRTLDYFKDVYQIHLLTGNEEKTVKFYESIGMKNVAEFDCVAFTKF